MITIRFNSKFQIIAQLFDSIRYEKNIIRTALCMVSISVTGAHRRIVAVTTAHTGHMIGYCCNLLPQ